MSEQMKVYLDTETVGLYGMPVLLQYAYDDGPIVLYNLWLEPIHKTLALIEEFLQHTIVGFNLAFDHFHLTKLYNTFRLCNPNWIPVEHINEIAERETEARLGPCLKPASALDLMLHARKRPYQSLMRRDPIRIRRVPTILASPLAAELERRVQLDGIYFARRTKDGPRWKVLDCKRRGTQQIDPAFKDIVLSFQPSGALKVLVEHALGIKPTHLYQDIEPPKEWRPEELGYAPFAEALANGPDWKVEKNYQWMPDDFDDEGVQREWEDEVYDAELNEEDPELPAYKIKHSGYAWPGVISKFIDFWATNEPAREYASNDIVYTRKLDHHFKTEPGDDDSILACAVASCRWRGFSLDLPGIKKLRAKAQALVDASPVNTNRAVEVRAYLYDVVNDAQRLLLDESTKKSVLTAISQQRFNKNAARRAKEILDVKGAKKEVELYNKLLRARRFYPSFNVIGTLSSRMSGGDGLNAQGIKHAEEVRRCFTLAHLGEVLCGGDFASFEVTLADAEFGDPKLHEDLLSGVKIHAVFGSYLFNKDYEAICDSDGTDNDMYTDGKRGVFALLYGGDWSTLMRNIGIAEEEALAAYNKFMDRYPQVAEGRERVFAQFRAVSQPGGEGTEVIWHEPADKVTSFLGFSRYFMLENQILRELFRLANDPPTAWRKCKAKVKRRERIQTAGGAASSALYGAIFALQGRNMRAAANHRIQSPGAQICKRVQRRIYDLQPVGVHAFKVQPMNIHDELETSTHPDYVERVANTVVETVESFREQVPLIGMDWFKEMENWDKKTGRKKVVIQYDVSAAA